MSVLKSEYHVKKKRPKNRSTKITTISIDPVLFNTVKAVNLNLSLVVRELLEEYLKLNFPKELRKEELKESL